jgi:Tol biopolymer transport system component
MRLRVPVLVALVAALMATTGGSAGAGPAPVNGPIAFAGLAADGNFEIFRMRPNGTDVRRLTNARGASIFSDWSPDGRWIAFDSDRTGNVELWLMDRNGGQEHQVTHFRQFAGDPSFSPDGSRLVFEKSPANGCCSNIYTVALDGTGLRQLTHFKVETFAFEPEYSPDGRWVAFTLLPPGGHEKVAIYLVRSDGSEIRRVTRQRLDAAHPSWSPDGSRIIFNDQFTGTTGDIFTIRPDGTGLERLTFVTPKGQVNFRPDYSPDGMRIVFNHLDEVGPDAPVEAWVMNADGSGQHRISRAGVTAFAPDWGPQVS